MPKQSGRISVSPGTAGEVLHIENNTDRLPKALLAIPDVARLLGVSPMSVRRLQRQRCIPFIKIGGSIRFLASDVHAYVEKHRVEAL